MRLTRRRLVATGRSAVRSSLVFLANYCKIITRCDTTRRQSLQGEPHGACSPPSSFARGGSSAGEYGHEVNTTPCLPRLKSRTNETCSETIHSKKSSICLFRYLDDEDVLLVRPKTVTAVPAGIAQYPLSGVRLQHTPILRTPDEGPGKCKKKNRRKLERNGETHF